MYPNISPDVYRAGIRKNYAGRLRKKCRKCRLVRLLPRYLQVGRNLICRDTQNMREALAAGEGTEALVRTYHIPSFFHPVPVQWFCNPQTDVHAGPSIVLLCKYTLVKLVRYFKKRKQSYIRHRKILYQAVKCYIIPVNYLKKECDDVFTIFAQHKEKDLFFQIYVHVSWVFAKNKFYIVEYQRMKVTSRR